MARWIQNIQKHKSNRHEVTWWTYYFKLISVFVADVQTSSHAWSENTKSWFQWESFNWFQRLQTTPWSPAPLHLHHLDLKTEWENETTLGLGLWTIKWPQQLWTGTPPLTTPQTLRITPPVSTFPVSGCFTLVINTSSTWQRVHVATATQPNLAPVFNPWGFEWIS